MKFKTLLLILFFLISKISFSQTLTGKVIDSKTEEVIIYAHIGIENKNIGTVSDENGVFEINLKNTDSSDIISFSSIGYQKKSFPLNQIKEKHFQVSLEKYAYPLSQITVEEKRLVKKSNKIKTIGRKKGRDNYTGSSQIGWGGEIGIKLKAKNKLYKIKSTNFKIMNISDDSILFRLNIYNISNGVPSQSLLNEPVYILGTKGQTWISKDLTDHNIFFKTDVIATIESVKAWSSSPRSNGVFYSNGLWYNSKTYFKESSMTQWRIGKDPKLTLFFTVEEYKTK